jgi:predicted permease
MIDYANLLGGLLTSEFPYIIMIFCGYFFAKYDILKSEGLQTLAKLMIEIFLPIYLFINVCRSTSIESLQKNFLVILSMIFYVLFAAAIGLLYSKLIKMDVRYRYTWIFLIAITDVKLIHLMMSKTFCYHIPNQSISENEFCKGILKNNFVHMFFQGLITWYLAFNMIRQDRLNSVIVKAVFDRVKNKKEEKIIVNIHYSIQITVSDDNKIKLKEICEKYDILKGIEGDAGKSCVTTKFMEEIKPFYKFEKQPLSKWYNEMIYVMLRPPLIGMCTGFVVGFITDLQTWLFNTKSAVFVRMKIQI